MTLDETRDYLDTLPCALALFWFVENVDQDHPHRTSLFFYCRERARRYQPASSHHSDRNAYKAELKLDAAAFERLFACPEPSAAVLAPAGASPGESLVKVRTSELIGPGLDWAAATCQFDMGNICIKTFDPKHPYVLVFHDAADPNKGGTEFAPSTDGAQGMEIIERENITFKRPCNAQGEYGPWHAELWRRNAETTPASTRWENGTGEGPTALIAAVRCFVASRRGETVSVPASLLAATPAPAPAPARRAQP